MSGENFTLESFVNFVNSFGEIFQDPFLKFLLNIFNVDLSSEKSVHQVHQLQAEGGMIAVYAAFTVYVFISPENGSTSTLTNLN